MWKDAIVDEVRAIREEHAREHGYDLDAIVSDLKTSEQSSAHAVVSLPPKPISPLIKSA